MITPREVFFLGTPFSGSTILGTALNQHSQIGYAGEIGYLGPYYKEMTGEQAKTLPICLDCGLKNTPCPVWDKTQLDRAGIAGTATVHDFARHRLQKPILVDGTKLPLWLKHVAGRRQFAIPPRVIITARNPYAFLVSLRQYHEERPFKAACLWRDTYADILCWCAAWNVPYVVVRHDDFMLDRARTMQRLCDWLAVGYEPAMAAQDYAAGKCSIGGNQGVGAVGKTPEARNPQLKTWTSMWARTGHGKLDDRWKSGVKESDVLDITRIVGLGDIAATLGFNLAQIVADYMGSRRPAFSLRDRIGKKRNE